MKKFLVFLVISVSFVYSFCEKNVDSLVEEVSEKTENIDFLYKLIENSIENKQYDKALSYALKAQKTNSTGYYKYKTHYLLAKIYYLNENYIESLSEFLNTKKLEKQIKNKNKFIDISKYIGNIYYFHSNYKSALNNYWEYLDRAYAINDSLQIAFAHYNVGLIYSNLKQYKKAEEHSLISLEIKKKLGNTKMYAKNLISVANFQKIKDNNQNALKTLSKALNIAQKNKFRDVETAVLLNIGSIFSEEKDYREAIHFFKKSLKIAESNYMIIGAYSELGNAYIQLNDFENANTFLNKAYERTKKTNLNTSLQEILFYKSMLYEKQKNYEKALYYYKNFSTLKDSIKENLSKTNQNLLNVQNEVFLKDRQIENLEKEKLLTEFKNKRKVFYLMVSITFLIVVLLAILFFYVNKHNTNKLLEQKNNQLNKLNNDLKISKMELEKANNSKNHLFSIIAHDLRNPFTSIIGTTHLLSSAYDDITEAKRKKYFKILNNTAQHVHSLLENLLQWAQTQLNSFKFKLSSLNLLTVVNSIINKHLNLANNKNIDIGVDIDERIFIEADINMLKLIIRNLLVNAIKYTDENGYIKISAKMVDFDLLVSVEDNGKGIKAENLPKIFNEGKNYTTEGTAHEKGTGLGLMLSQEFIKQHHGKIWVESVYGEGTKFSFTIPQK